MMRRPLASIAVSFMVVSCVQAEKTVPSESPTAGISPIAAPAASATAAPATFADLAVLVATGADLQRYRGGRWELVARVCPGATNSGKAIAALRVTDDGTRALVVCWQTPPGVTDNGNHILDCQVGLIADPAGLEQALRAIPGVVGTGLFVGLVDTVMVQAGGTVQIKQRSP